MPSYDELRMLQALPLEVKIRKTEERIEEWVDYYGLNGVYISFSGGKDSTVLMDIVRNRMKLNIPAVFVDVPTQYPELKQFAMTWDNLTIIKPKISFVEVCEKYGFPLISKEVSESVAGVRKYLTSLLSDGTLLTDRQIDRQIPYHYCYERVTGTGRYAKTKGIPNSEQLAEILNDRLINRKGGSNQRLANMLGWRTKDPTHPVQLNPKEHDRSNYTLEKYKFFLEAPFEISNKCCNVMKKTPIHEFEKKTHIHGITAQMADESKIRTQKWLQNGCNSFNAKHPISNPLSFWTEQDILKYIHDYNLPICSVYGEVVEDYEAEGQLEGQISMFGVDRIYKTTGCKRTGCMLCGFGCHLEKSPNRFELLAQTHPRMLILLDNCKNNGVTYRQAIEWINENGKNIHINLPDK